MNFGPGDAIMMTNGLLDQTTDYSEISLQKAIDHNARLEKERQAGEKVKVF